MKLQGAFLASRLRRRIFTMFGLAVAIPALVVFWLTYRNSAALSEKNDAASLRAENKHFALSVFERIAMARLVLARSHQDGDRRELQEYAPLFTSVSEVEPADMGPLSGSDELGRARLLIVPDNGAAPSVAVATRSNDPSNPRLLMGVLDPRYLWGDPDAAVSDSIVCVDAGTIQLACMGEALGQPEAGQVEDEWELFLKPEFGVDSWTFRAVRNRQENLGDYAGLIVPVAIGLLLLALLLSSIEIRRILIPLELLLARIKSISGGRAGIPARSDDEFATLANAFNEMEARISSQIQTLTTLQLIDELILMREPLERVVRTVLQRIDAIAGGRPLALSLDAFDSHDAQRHYLVLPGADGLPLQGASPIDDGGATLQATGRHWRTTQAAGSGFAGLEIASIAYLTLGPKDGPLVRLAVGNEAVGGSPPTPAVEDTQQIVELVERVAVALTAEAHERRLVHQARHDLLTDLPNRLAVLEVMPELIGRAGAMPGAFATLFIDLDRFKAINDGLGHALGNTVLFEVAKRIRAAVGTGPLVARLGGDEFLVIAPDAHDASAALTIDRVIRESLQAPVIVGNDALTIDFSGGIALCPADGTDPDTLLHHADLAMYRAKRSGGGHTIAFDVEMNQSAIRRVQLENDLRAALQQGGLALHYQPRVDSRTGAIVAAEALLRWEHPALGRIMPDDFIPLAEECGLIIEVGRFVINEACRQLAQWKRAGLALPLMAINVSSHQLRGGDLFNIFSHAISANDIKWCEVEIEITESVLIRDSARAGEQLQRLRDAGATVAIDDFGTGYSSLAYLAGLPNDTIKIDRAFSRSLHDPDNHAVVISIIALAKALGKNIVAEGVERPEDVAALAAWGCYVIQGYVYYKPMPAAGLSALLAMEPMSV